MRTGPRIIHPKISKENKVHAIQMTAGPDLDRRSVDTSGACAFCARNVFGTIKRDEDGLKMTRRYAPKKRVHKAEIKREKSLRTQDLEFKIKPTIKLFVVLA